MASSRPCDHRPIPDDPSRPEGPATRHQVWARWRVPRQDGPLRRSTTDRMAGGVAGGLSARFGIDANVIRLLFAVLSIGDGSGFALYVLAWLVMTRQGESAPIGRRALADRRTVALGLALATILGCLLLALVAVGLGFAANLIWPVSLGAAGLVVVWRAASADERAFLDQLVEQAPVLGLPDHRTRRALAGRVVVGVVLVAAGLGGLVATRHPTGATLEAMASAAVVVVGFLVVFGPWWLALARDLAVERRQRVRTEERADMAAAVHDSVLQTLALIQRSSADPAEVTRLARAQERELRAWLFGARPPGSFGASDVATLAAGVALIERDVEESHRVAVESVVVGDCELTDELRALLAAGRARRPSTPPPGRAPPRSRCSPRSSRAGCRCSCATGARDSIPTPSVRTTGASPIRSGPGWPATAGRPHPQRPGAGHGGGAGHAPAPGPVMSAGHRPAGLPGRRPPVVPFRGPGRARARGRGGGRGRRGGGGHRADRRTPARRRPGRRAHARRRRPGRHRGGAGRPIPTCVSWPCRSPTRPRTSSA